MGVGGNSVEHPLDSKFHFHGKFWIHLIKFVTLFLILLFNKSILLSVNVCNIAGSVANSTDPDQMLCSAASNLDLHCLLRPVCPNT